MSDSGAGIRNTRALDQHERCGENQTSTRLAVPAGLIVLLCVPYVEASRLYGFERPWSETATMLPRPESYLLASNSRLWPYLAGLFPTLPMRHEHVMFIGVAPLLAITVAVALGLAPARRLRSAVRAVCTVSILSIMLLTLWVDGHSAYGAIAWLPGANAIRAITRVITVLIFLWGLLLAASIDTIAAAALPKWLRAGTVTLHRARQSSRTLISCIKRPYARLAGAIATVAAELPRTIPPSPILLLAPRPSEPEQWPRELDAMLFAQDHGWPTLNGYSGNAPPGHD